MPRTLLVTGASGFVGHHLLPELSRAFPETRLIPTSRRPGGKVGGIDTARLEFERPAEIRSALEAWKPDAVIHLSGLASPSVAADDPAAARRSNYDDAVGFAEIVRTFFPETIFIFISSAVAYGESALSGAALDETAPLRPVDVYGETKAKADLAIGEMAGSGLRSIRLRPFNHTGPGQPEGYAISDFAGRIARIEAKRAPPEIEPKGSLDSVRDFLDVRDVCRAYAATVRHAAELEPGTALNIASGVPRRLGDILDRMLALSGVAATVRSKRPDSSAKGIPCLYGDPSKARQSIGWAPEIPFDQTLLDTIDWWRQKIR